MRETVVIEPDEVKADPDLYERIGVETTFEVDITPTKLFKREIVRPKYRFQYGSKNRSSWDCLKRCRNSAETVAKMLSLK